MLGYDGNGNVVTATDSLSHTTAYTYDLAGNLAATTDPLTHTTAYTYDVANQRTGTRQADGSLLSTGYDPGGNVITQTDAAGRVTAYAYDPLGRTTAMTDPLSRPTAYRYDLAGNRASLTDALGRVTTYGYDPLNRTSAITYSDGSTPNVTYTYTPTGPRRSMTDGTGTTTYGYDALERTVAVTNGAGQAVAYAYNPVGDTTAITYPGGVAVARTFDPLDRVTALRDWLGHTSTFGYDPAGNPISETLPNTTSVVWSYNAADALTGITRTAPTTAPRVYAYGRDGLGQVTSATDSAAPTARGYRYSALNQLQGDTSGITYTASSAYDLQGITTTGTTSSLTYDPAHELTSLQTLSGTTPTRALTLASNGDGNRVAVTNTVSGATTGYRYDQADRLIGVTSGVTTSSYAYDGDGLRQGKTVKGAATAATWDVNGGLPTLLQEQVGGGTTRSIAGPDGLPIEQVDASGNTLYSYRDQLGSTRELGDGGGRIVAASRYDAYGAPLAKTGTASTPFGYAGAYTDGETGLQYLQARYYDPSTSQFLTRDPLVSMTGQPYAYTGNNPLNATDPSGQLCVFGVHVPGTLNDCPGSGQGAGSAARGSERLPARVDPLNPDTAGRGGLPSWGSVDGAVLVPVMNCSVAGVAYPGPGGLGGVARVAAGLAEGVGAGVAAVGAGLAAVAASPGIVAAGLATVAIAPAGYLVYDGLSQGDYFGEPVLPPGGLPTPPPFPNAGLGCQSGLITCPDAGSQTLGIAPQTPAINIPTHGGYTPVRPRGYMYDQHAAPSNFVPPALQSRAQSNPETGRSDLEHGSFDSALRSAQENAGELGPHPQRMYDPETGTLIGEQSTDGRNGWRIDSGHVNWWNWLEGKKGMGGRYGHDFFPESQSGPHSEHIGYAPWIPEPN